MEEIKFDEHGRQLLPKGPFLAYKESHEGLERFVLAQESIFELFRIGTRLFSFKRQYSPCIKLDPRAIGFSGIEKDVGYGETVGLAKQVYELFGGDKLLSLDHEDKGNCGVLTIGEYYIVTPDPKKEDEIAMLGRLSYDSLAKGKYHIAGGEIIKIRKLLVGLAKNVLDLDNELKERKKIKEKIAVLNKSFLCEDSSEHIEHRLGGGK